MFSGGIEVGHWLKWVNLSKAGFISFISYLSNLFWAETYKSCLMDDKSRYPSLIRKLEKPTLLILH